MSSITKATVVTLKNSKNQIIEIEAESIEVCTKENCSCVGSWGHHDNWKEVEDAKKEGFRVVSQQEISS